jgi:DNA-binding transcriptional ArsR family regulator
VARPTASEDVFRAVADPTRRAVLELLGQEPEVPVTRLAVKLQVSLPLLSRHLAVLRAADLVTERRHGRQRLYSLRPEPLRELYDWAAVFTRFWDERIHNLNAYLQRRAANPDDSPARPVIPEAGDHNHAP